MPPTDREQQEDDGDNTPGNPKSKKSTKPPAKLADRWKVTAQPEFHIHRMLNDAAKSIISLLPGRASELLHDLTSIARDFKLTCDMYLRFGFNSNAKEPDLFPDLLNATATSFQCCCPEDRDRPPTGAVREARRLMSTIAQEGGPSSDVAKALLAYPCGQCLMSMSKQYSASGIEDDAAAKLLESIIDSFEDSFNCAYTDSEAWAHTASDGGPISFAGLHDKLLRLLPIVTRMESAIQRWSVRGLEANFDKLETIIKNNLQIIGLVLLMMCKVAYRRFRTMSWPAVSAAIIALPTAMASSSQDDAAASAEGIATSVAVPVAGLPATEHELAITAFPSMQT